MRFITGEDLHAAIRQILQSKAPRCAVAFWGRGAETKDLLPSAAGARIICNLKMGGTNPDVIRKLIARGASVQQDDRLHAKVYLGDEMAVVTSANASANGLALEGIEQTHWSEAGIELDIANAETVASWFEQVWKHSRPITNADLKAAKIVWQARRNHRPTITFADYDVEAEHVAGRLPITSWWIDHRDWVDDEAVLAASEGSYWQEMTAMALETEEDVRVMPPGSWLLWWKRGVNGQPLSAALTLSQAGRSVPNGMRDPNEVNENVFALLNKENPDPQPFNPADRLFGAAFREVIVQAKYDQLRSDDGPPWFTPLKPLLLDFWMQVKARYVERAAENAVV